MPTNNSMTISGMGGLLGGVIGKTGRALRGRFARCDPPAASRDHAPTTSARRRPASPPPYRPTARPKRAPRRPLPPLRTPHQHPPPPPPVAEIVIGAEPMMVNGVQEAEPESPPKQKKHKGHFRNPMPAQLEHVPVTGTVPDEQTLRCNCCSTLRVKVNEVIYNSRLEFKPAVLFVEDFTYMFHCCFIAHCR